MKLLSRFPDGRQVLPVSAVICFMIYAWTLLGMFRLLSVSWILFMGLGDILALVAYQVLTALIECLILLGVLLLLSAVLPGPALRAVFAVRGSLISFSFLGSLMLYYQFFLIQELLSRSVYWLVSFVFATSTLLFLVDRIRAGRQFVLSVAERFTIFLYVLLPIAGLSLIVVLVRNLG